MRQIIKKRRNSIFVFIILFFNFNIFANVINNNYSGTLKFYNNSKVDISYDAKIDTIQLFDNSNLSILDGHVNYMEIYNDSFIDNHNSENISGILIKDNGQMNLWHHEDITSFCGELYGYGGMSGFSYRTQQPFEYHFMSIETRSKINYIPEVSTIILMGTGCLILMEKRKNE
ncbi:MAG: hypothetical protein ACOCP8_05720 [archaeon]